MARLFLAIFIGKCVLLATKIFTKTGGSAAPGLIALKIDPEFISKLSSKIGTNVVITGTNGKTTTSAMLSQILRTSKNIVHNSSGSNLSRGIASKLLSTSSLWGGITADVGIWEADEAAFVDIVEKIKPQHIIILNIARDQLDRYGEIDTVIKKWRAVLAKSQWKKTLYLNSDDGNVYEMRNIAHTTIQTFGVENSPVQFEKVSKNPQYDIKAKILGGAMDGIDFVFASSFTTSEVTSEVVGQRLSLPVTGSYNVYNFLAAYSVSMLLGISVEEIIRSISSFTPAFGRMETVMFGKTEGLIALIKNPAGTTQVIQTIAPLLKKNDQVLIMLNDNIADGKDVSWIWDADFEKIAPHLSEVHVTGTRRYDMALRLNYAGVKKENIIISDKTPRLDTLTQNNAGRLFILPTYTALLELQRYLKVHKFKEKHWHE